MKLALFALLLVGLLAWEYVPAMRGGFVYEDANLNDACDRARFVWYRQTRPLTMGSWCTQRTSSPLARHAVNLALHGAVTALVGGLVWAVTREVWASAFAAAFFGLNAVGVEAVAYLSGRSELIAALGVTGACLAALQRRWWLVGVGALVGVGGKESAIVALLLVPLCLWYARGPRWAWGVGLGAVLVGGGIARRTATWWVDWAPGSWALLQVSAWARLSVLSVLPFGQTVDYDYAHVPLALQVVALAALVAAGWWARASRLRWFGACWVALASAPRLIVPTPRSVFSEHQFYLPLVGMAIVLASCLTQESHGHYRPAL